ncbi:hypothetical protein [Microbacterium sp. NPDC096154]|uniref:hypothetical protein n=1 Tax=Microbacterium sp. NPDC096154 TaxID=3155549 RepID=UPI0033220097
MGSTLVTDEKLDLMLGGIAPCTLPPDAWGPQPIEWQQKHPSVRAWISWPHRVAERVEAFAAGWNDRVVVVRWHTERGMRETVVWRNAVTRAGTTNA